MVAPDPFHYLSHQDVTLRKQALLALSRNGDPALLKLLIGQHQLFEGELQEILVNIFVRNRSRWAAQIATELLYATRDTMRQLGVTILHQLGEVSLEPLNRLRHSKHPRVRMGVLQAMAGIYPSVKKEWIAPFLQDPDHRIVKEAVELVARYGDEATVWHLKDTFLQYPELRSTILWAMARYFHPQQLLHFFQAYFIHDADLLDTFLTILDGYAPAVVQPIITTLIAHSLREHPRNLGIIARHLHHQPRWEISNTIIPGLKEQQQSLSPEVLLTLLAGCKHITFFQAIAQFSQLPPQGLLALQHFCYRFPFFTVEHFREIPPALQELVVTTLLANPTALPLKQWLILLKKLHNAALITQTLTTLKQFLSPDRQHFIEEALRRFSPRQFSEILHHTTNRRVREVFLTAYLKAVPLSHTTFQQLKQHIRGLGYLLPAFFEEAIQQEQWEIISYINELDSAEIFYLFSHCGQRGYFTRPSLFTESWNRLSPANRPALLLALIQSLSPTDISAFFHQLPVEISARTMIINSKFLDLLALQNTKTQYIFLTLIYFE